jgi:hypothetical protein
VPIKLFVREECPLCPAAIRACEGFAGVEVYDLDHADGFAEAVSYGVISTPSVLVVDSEGREVAGWRGSAPERARLRMYEVLS